MDDTSELLRLCELAANGDVITIARELGYTPAETTLKLARELSARLSTSSVGEDAEVAAVCDAILTVKLRPVRDPAALSLLSAAIEACPEDAIKRIQSRSPLAPGLITVCEGCWDGSGEVIDKPCGQAYCPHAVAPTLSGTVANLVFEKKSHFENLAAMISRAEAAEAELARLTTLAPSQAPTRDIPELAAEYLDRWMEEIAEAFDRKRACGDALAALITLIRGASTALLPTASPSPLTEDEQTTLKWIKESDWVPRIKAAVEMINRLSSPHPAPLDTSERDKLTARFKSMKDAGQLLDIKFDFAPMQEGVTVEDVCREVNSILDAIEHSELTPFRFNDSHKPAPLEAPALPEQGRVTLRELLDETLTALGHALAAVTEHSGSQRVGDCDLCELVQKATATQARVHQAILSVTGEAAGGEGLTDQERLAVDQLRPEYQRQADMDGCMVKVSRQACDETVAIIDRVFPASTSEGRG